MAMRIRSTLVGAAIALAAGQVDAQSSGAGIVEEALQGVRQDQARDSERVRRMVDEAVQGARAAPSGEDTVNPAAPDILRPLVDVEAPGVLPVGYAPADLVGRPIDDGTGARIGTIRDLVLDEGSGVARAMVAFDALFDQPAKTSVVPIESLSTATARGEGLVIELTTVTYAAMPAYAKDGPVWRKRGR
jgi:hypothetical protein